MSASPKARRARDTAAALLVAFVTTAAFWPVLSNGFIGYDDGIYVTRNPHVKAGLTAEGARWALTTDRAANWHPLTWLSHMADVEAFGLEPRGHHATSLALHVANAVLLFYVLASVTGARGRSLVVAALFGVHPLHVESVAWVAERKDVLSTLFGFLALGAYLRYTRSPGPGRMVLVALLLAAGLAAKPMLVTLPFVLILLDAWPLNRFRSEDLRLLVVEKVPLLALAAASSIVTVVVQRRGGALAALEDVPLLARIANAIVSYAWYLAKTVWPDDLAIFYPHPIVAHPVRIVALAAAVLLAITLGAVRERHRRPYLLAGWLWYVGTLVPVIGLVQVGAQAMADRYTYLPLVGIFVMVVWGLADLAGRRRVARRAAAVAALIAVAACGVATRAQAARWNDSATLYRHALDVTGENPMVLLLMGMMYADDHRWDEALLWYERAGQARPLAAWPMIKAGEALVRLGRIDDALARSREAVRLAPDHAEAHNALGIALARAGRTGEAEEHFAIALRLDPEHVPALANLGSVRMLQGRPDEGMTLYRRALAIEPDYPEALSKLGLALAERGLWAEAITPLRRAVDLDPRFAEARHNLALTLALSGDRDGARREMDEARRLGFEPPPALRAIVNASSREEQP